MDQNIIRGQSTITLSSTAYTGVLSVADTVYVDGAKYIITPSQNSIEGATLNLNSIGAYNLVKLGRVKINTDDLTANRKYEVIYDATHSEFVVQGLPNLINAFYIFANNGGAQGTINLTSLIPVGIYLKASEAIISIEDQLSSAGLALVEWGIGGGVTQSGFIDSKRPFNDKSTYGRAQYGWSFKAQNVPYATFEITAGAAGTIDTVTLGGINILTGVVAYNSSLTVTARDVAKNINSNPMNGIRASYSGAVVYLYLASLSKFCFDPYTIAMSATATTMTVGNFNNLGFNGDVSTVGYFVDAYRPGLSSLITFKISGANLLGGTLRMSMPYEISQ